MDFQQIYIGGQGTGVLHEEDSEEEGQGCWYCLKVFVSSLCHNFLLNNLSDAIIVSVLLEATISGMGWIF